MRRLNFSFLIGLRSFCRNPNLSCLSLNGAGGLSLVNSDSKGSLDLNQSPSKTDGDVNADISFLSGKMQKVQLFHALKVNPDTYPGNPEAIG